MARNHFANYGTQTIAADNGTQILDIDLVDLPYLKLLIEVTYPTTSTPTGVTLSIYQGFGAQDSTVDATGLYYVWGGSSVPTYGQNDVGPVILVAPSAGSGSPQTTATSFFLNDILNSTSRWVRLVWTNTDASVDATLTVLGDF